MTRETRTSLAARAHESAAGHGAHLFADGAHVAANGVNGDHQYKAAPPLDPKTIIR